LDRCNTLIPDALPNPFPLFTSELAGLLIA